MVKTRQRVGLLYLINQLQRWLALIKVSLHQPIKHSSRPHGLPYWLPSLLGFRNSFDSDHDSRKP